MSTTSGGLTMPVEEIGAIMEYGATIIIPPRPFLHPVMEKYRPQVIENYREAIRSVMGVCGTHS